MYCLEKMSHEESEALRSSGNLSRKADKRKERDKLKKKRKRQKKAKLQSQQQEEKEKDEEVVAAEEEEKEEKEKEKLRFLYKSEDDSNLLKEENPKKLSEFEKEDSEPDVGTSSGSISSILQRILKEQQHQIQQIPTQSIDTETFAEQNSQSKDEGRRCLVFGLLQIGNHLPI